MPLFPEFTEYNETAQSNPLKIWRNKKVRAQTITFFDIFLFTNLETGWISTTLARCDGRRQASYSLFSSRKRLGEEGSQDTNPHPPSLDPPTQQSPKPDPPHKTLPLLFLPDLPAELLYVRIGGEGKKTRKKKLSPPSVSSPSQKKPKVFPSRPHFPSRKRRVRNFLILPPLHLLILGWRPPVSFSERIRRGEEGEGPSAGGHRKLLTERFADFFEGYADSIVIIPLLQRRSLGIWNKLGSSLACLQCKGAW